MQIGITFRSCFCSAQLLYPCCWLLLQTPSLPFTFSLPYCYPSPAPPTTPSLTPKASYQFQSFTVIASFSCLTLSSRASLSFLRSAVFCISFFFSSSLLLLWARKECTIETIPFQSSTFLLFRTCQQRMTKPVLKILTTSKIMSIFHVVFSLRYIPRENLSSPTYNIAHKSLITKSIFFPKFLI